MARGEMESAACTNCGLVRFESNGERLLRSATPGWTTPCRWCESWRVYGGEQVIAHANPYCPAHGAIANSSAAAATRASLAASQCSKTVPGIDSVEPWPCSLLAGHEGDCE